MVGIVDSRSVQRRLPSGTQRVASYSDPGAGQAQKVMAGIIGEISDQRDKSSLAKAENDFLLMKAKEDNAYDEDEDYSTIESRWHGNVSGGLGEIAAGITNPAVRDQFVAKHKVAIEHGRQRMEGMARTKEHDYERADLNDRLERTVDVGISGGNFMEAYQSAANLIDSNIALTEVEKQTQKRAIKTRIATGRLEYLEPEQRLEEVKKLKEHLPPDVVAKYMREAETALRDDKAQAAVDSVINSMSYDDAQKWGKKQFKDADDRDEFNRRLDYEHRRNENAKIEQQKELHEKYFLDVRNGDTSLSDIPEAEQIAMGSNMMKSLYAAQGSFASAKPIKSNRDVLWTLHKLSANPDPSAKVALNKFFVENSHLLGDTDFKSWASVASEQGAPVEVKSMLTTQQTILTKFAKQEESGHSYNVDDKNLMLDDLNQWHMEYQEEHQGKLPGDTERNDKIDELLTRYATTGWFMGDDDMPVFKMDDAQLSGAISQLQSDDKDNYDKAVAYMVRNNQDPRTTSGKRYFLNVIRKLRARDAVK